MTEVPYYATHNLHAAMNGRFSHVEFSEKLLPYIIRKNIYKKPGDMVEFFDNAAKALGILFLKFPNRQTMADILGDMNHHITICLE